MGAQNLDYFTFSKQFLEKADETDDVACLIYKMAQKYVQIKISNEIIKRFSLNKEDDDYMEPAQLATNIGTSLAQCSLEQKGLDVNLNLV